MKNIVISSLISIFISINCSIKNLNMQEDITFNEYSDVIFESGEYEDKRWKSDCDYNGNDCVPDVESAIQIANLIFDNHCKNIDLYKEFKFKLQKIFYDEIDNVWVAEFFPSYDELGEGIGIAGGELFIAISRKNAKVLAIWGGE